MKRKFNYVHLKVKFLRPIVAEKTPRYNGDTQQRKEWPLMVCQLTPAQEARMYEILRGIADDPTRWRCSSSSSTAPSPPTSIACG